MTGVAVAAGALPLLKLMLHGAVVELEVPCAVGVHDHVHETSRDCGSRGWRGCLRLSAQSRDIITPDSLARRRREKRST